MKKYFCSILFLAGLFVLGSFPAEGAQNYYFSSLTSDQGLSHNTIKCITQDSYGFIWIGTKNGLNRYDGEKIRVVDCDDYLSGHSNHNISALYEDDRRQLWVGTDRGVYVYDHITEVFTHFSKTAEDGAVITDWISAINSDSNGNIWIVSPKEGVFRWNGEELFHYYLTPSENYLVQHPESMCILRNGQVWIGTTGAGLFRYHPDTDRFEQFLIDRNGNSLEGDYIFAMCEYGGSLAIAAHEGKLKKYDFQSGLFSLIDAPQVHNTLLRDVKWLGGSELWVATHEGVFIVNEEKRTTTQLSEDAFNPYAISDKACSVIYQDREKGIWLGTMLGGVNYCANNVLTFDKYIPYDRQESVLCKRIRGLAEGSDGRIWIGTEDNGMYVLNPETGSMRTVEYRRAKEERLLNTLGHTVEGDELWYGTFKHGLCKVNMRSGKLSHIESSTLGVNGASVYAIYNDSHGNTWLSTESDTYVRRHSSDKLTVVENLRGSWVFNIMEDSRGYIWFACMGTGLVRYNPANKNFIHYISGDRSNLSSYSVNSVFEDSRGRIWISTERGGLCLYNHETDDFVTYSIAEGLPDDVVYKILEDSRGMLWFGTNKGLVEFDPNSGKVVMVYTHEDGLLGNQFNYNAAIKDRNGRLWFGGVDGLISFLPEKNVPSDYIPQLFVTQLTINNVEQTVGSEESPLQKSILFTDKVILEHDQSNIDMEFAATHFSNSGSVKYFYRMDGIENDWIEAKDSRRVFYSQLSPGEYTFHVRAVNSINGWQQDSLPLHIVVRSPWWWTGIAKVLYAILLVAATVFGIRIFLRRRRAQMLEQQKLFEIEKEKELYRNKVDFFNEIAHEVRTPLTLINGPLEDVMEMNTDGKLDKNLKIISKNTKRLLDLIHQLLDFRNIDTNKFRMNYFVTDIPALVTGVVERFEPSIKKCGKVLSMEKGENFVATVDREALTKILSNLLSNAMKYAASQIVVSISKTDDSFSVIVNSDGDKIPFHLAEKIFEPFYRMEKAASIPGTGIGLSLSRSLAQLQKGHLFLDVHASEESNRFVLTLPLQNEGVIALDSDESEEEFIPDSETITVSTPDGEYKVLLVEDSLSLRDYLAYRLKESCTVETATNGVEALNVLQVQSVDMVVTDIMMPDMDGIELCRRMKQDENLQYIPVVFLTARNDLHTKIEGLEVGAEAFIEKPFSFAYFKALIFSIMDNRRKERELFIKRPFVPASNIKMNTADQEFIDKVIDIIHRNITDENLNVEYLADKMCMNRSSLLRKIKSITNISAVDFIKVVRLKQAAIMLREGRYRINEVCYAVGINSPSYFSKLFHAQFGMLPKDFERQNHK